MKNEITAYPLCWPAGWPRTEKRTENSPFQVKVGAAIDDLFGELQRLGAKNVILSSNLTVNTFHRPYAKQPKQDDPGIAVYFELDDQQMVMARDKFADWRDNIRSLGLAIEAFRALHRHGGAYMMKRAFSGFAALPDMSERTWKQIFNIPEGMKLKKELRSTVETRYRTMRSVYHPDKGGSALEFDRIVKAYEKAMDELS